MFIYCLDRLDHVPTAKWEQLHSLKYVLDHCPQQASVLMCVSCRGGGVAHSCNVRALSICT
jgi:hypothetical protein